MEPADAGGARPRSPAPRRGCRSTCSSPFVVAGRDEVVFPDLGVALHDAYPGPRWMWVDPGATHNGVDGRPGNGRWRALVEFLAAAR